MKLFILIPLSFIVFEDFKYRAIHWVWLAVLFVIILLAFPINIKWILMNYIFIAIEIIAITIYFSVKHKQFINITLKYLGIGDILFFFTIAIFFNPIELMQYFIYSFSIILLGILIFRFILSKKEESIPLAGCMALSFMLYFLCLNYFQANVLKSLF